MARADRVAAVTELTDRFRESDSVVLTEYRGLSVSQLRALRQSLGDNATFSVVKNTLTKIAVSEVGLRTSSRRCFPARLPSRSSAATWSRRPRACATSPGTTPLW